MTPGRWQLLASRYVHADRWVKLRIDECLTPRGERIDDYHVVEYPEWVNVVALTPSDELVLVREYRHGARRVVTGLPSGVVRARELPRSAARRELAEETGLRSATFTKLGTFFANPSNQTNSVSTFLALDVMPTTATAWDPNEQIQIVRVGFVDAIDRSRRARVRMQGLHLAALHLASCYILASRSPRLRELRSQLHRRLVASRRT